MPKIKNTANLDQQQQLLTAIKDNNLEFIKDFTEEFNINFYVTSKARLDPRETSPILLASMMGKKEIMEILFSFIDDNEYSRALLFFNNHHNSLLKKEASNPSEIGCLGSYRSSTLSSQLQESGKKTDNHSVIKKPRRDISNVNAKNINLQNSCCNIL